jgi:formiminoglutamase
MSRFRPIDKELLFSRDDAEDPRLGESVILDESLSPDSGWVVAGYPDDEGIRLNGGRPGAAYAPPAIRRWLYKMTPSLRMPEKITLVDRGDLDPTLTTLEDRHAHARAEAARTMKAGANWIGLGGGHDYGFPDAAAFIDAVGLPSNPLVLNFDAHLDVRSSRNGFHSGTPFRRFLEEFPQTDFVEIGIQSQCNSKFHLAWLEDHPNADVLFLDDLTAGGGPAGPRICEALLPRLERPRPIFISVDLDAVSSAFAPGCSQSWPYGLTPNDLMLALDFICARGRVRGAGFYEVSPPLDHDDRTSRLAAQLIHKIVFHRGADR